MYPLIFVRVVKALDHSVALLAFESSGALVPTDVLLKSLAVFSHVLEIERRPPEISHVVSIHAAL